MKFLVSPALQNASAALQNLHTGDSIIQGRLEAYSCKRAAADKKLSEELERKLSNDQPSGTIERALSGQQSSSVERQYSGFTPVLSSSVGPNVGPEELILGESPGGGTEDTMSGSLGVIPDYTMRKLFINLLLTLNSIYPDYDFSSVRPEEFVEESNFDLIVHSINAALSKAMAQNPAMNPALWAAIEEVIQPRNCQIYSYIPDVESSPFGEGSLWSFNYFMFNKSLKRVLFFTCSCVRPGDEHVDMDEDDEEMGYDEHIDDFARDRQMDFSMDDM